MTSVSLARLDILYNANREHRIGIHPGIRGSCDYFSSVVPTKERPSHLSWNDAYFTFLFFICDQKRAGPHLSDGCKCTALLTPDALRALLTQSFQMQAIHYVRITDLKPHLKCVQPKVLTVFRRKKNGLNADVERLHTFPGVSYSDIIIP